MPFSKFLRFFLSTIRNYGLSTLKLVAKLEFGLFGAVQVHQASRIEHEVFRETFLEGLCSVQEFCRAAARKERLTYLHRDIFRAVRFTTYLAPHLGW